MKVAFVYPEVYDVARFGKERKEFPPFGVLYLATIVSMQNGMSVQVFSVSSADTSLDLTDFDVVAFSVSSSVTYHIIKGVRRISTYARDVLLLAGGVHAGLFPEQTLLDLDVHAVGIGYGDETILELIRQKNERCFSQVRGICFRRSDKLMVTEERPLTKDLNHLPVILGRNLLPDPDFVMTDRLANTDLRMTHVMMTRGCPFSCNFCASWQKRLQYRSGWHVRSELEYLKRTYAIEGFAETGDNFMVNKRRVGEICNAIADLGLRWSALSRVDTVDYDSLEAVHDAGCIEIKYGIESGSEKILKAMGKGISLDQIYNAVKITHAAGIMIKAFIVHGYPGENTKTTQATIRMLRDLAPMVSRISLFRFVPLPGSAVYNDIRHQMHTSTSDWGQCHIHHNPNHWWGTEEDFAIVEASYQELNAFILDIWG
ncbi:B12-binding domain-containing radical SAM protein [Patescibacteria group bacterium]